MRILACFFLSIASALAWPASAQDIPGRVGRLSYIDGSVGLYQDPDRGWDEAYVNSPITSRNSVWTDPGARAEVVVGPMALRMDEASQLDVSSLDDFTLDATLESGSVEAHIRHFRAGDVVRLSTPRASFLLQSAGRYRLDADPDRGESRLSVFSGVAAMETAGGRLRIRAGQSVVVWGDDFPQYAFQDVATTELDRWAMARDARWAESRAPQYVSYEMTGYEDLDVYGEWNQDPVYGALWFPTRVDPDWAPYRFGRWTYVQPWGWTWIDSEPWGYAPFHYGRWVHVRDRWAWCPGRRVDRPAWAPALVGFIGGSGWSASVSSGAPVVGWYPLAPSEPYRPWYSASRGYVSRVNAAVRNVPQDLARSHVEWNRDRAATVVRREALVERRPVQQARVQVAPEVVRRAPAITTPTTALPSREEFHRAQRNQLARAPTPPAPPAQSGGAPAVRNGTARSAPQANALSRPSFAKPSTAPRAAPANAAPPPSPIARTPSSAPGQPARGNEAARDRDRAAREAQQQQERTTREAQQRDRAASEAAQRERSAEQERQRATQEQQRAAQQRAAQEQQRAQQRAAQDQQRAAQERERAAQEQQRVQQRSAEEQQRAAREADRERQRTSRDAAQQQQRAAQEAQQQRERASREAEQQRAAQQRAAQERERAAQEQQRAAQQRAAQEQQRAAQEQQRAAQQRAAQEQQRAAQEQQRAQQRAAQEQQRAAQAQQRAAQEQPQGAKPQAGRAPPPDRGEEHGKGRDEREKGSGG